MLRLYINCKQKQRFRLLKSRLAHAQLALWMDNP